MIFNTFFYLFAFTIILKRLMLKMYGFTILKEFLQKITAIVKLFEIN